MTPDITFIIPSHNVQQYIEACVSSIARAADLDYEIVVVDDASTDGTVEVLRRLEEKLHGRLSVIALKQNAGPGAARNLAASKARGRYLAFIDSDDFVAASTYRELIELCDRFKADFGWLKAIRISQTNGDIFGFADAARYEDVVAGQAFTVTNVKDRPDIAGLEPSCCNRIFAREFFFNAVSPFPEGTLYEDLVTHFRAVSSATHIVVLNEVGYYYRVDRPGQRTSINDEARFDAIPILQELNRNSFYGLDARAGKFALKYVTDFAIWCSSVLPFSTRSKFLAALSPEFEKFPATWVKSLGNEDGDRNVQFIRFVTERQFRQASALSTGSMLESLVQSELAGETRFKRTVRFFRRVKSAVIRRGTFLIRGRV